VIRGFNFTEPLRAVLANARQEAARLGESGVAQEHLLLALLHGEPGVAHEILTALGADAERLEAEVERLAGTGCAPELPANVPYTRGAKKVLELAMAEARQLGHSYIGPEHLLLGLLSDRKSAVAQVLTDAGVSLAEARDEARRLLGSGTVDAPVPTPWTRLPGRVRAIITQAHGVAVSCGRPTVTAEDAAAALLVHGEGMANAVLDRLGLDRERAIASFNGHSQNGASEPAADARMALAPDLVAALDAMRRAQRDTRDPQPGTQHLLLGILAASPRVSAVLAEQRITADDVQRLTRQMSG